IAKKESFLIKRSYCPHCKHPLSWHDLFPVASFLSLKGKCRYCQEPISAQYPLVELATGAIFSLVFYNNLSLLSSVPFDFWILNLFFLFFVSSVLIIIFVYDLKHYIIPDKIIFPAILIATGWRLGIAIFYEPYQEFTILNGFLSALGAAAFFFSIVWLSKGKGMGMGDVKFVILMGMLLGFPEILMALLLSFLLGSVVGVFLIMTGKKGLKSEVPFAPFLVTGTFLVMFCGEKLFQLLGLIRR
ncbi:MAG: hypothetical protein GF370_01965, partial [Candidatus Nealsonbacteria bacterium]|nr:hypothetical protein [Candidatus Nealsonbacteria bacterium]